MRKNRHTPATYARDALWGAVMLAVIVSPVALWFGALKAVGAI